MTERVSLMMSSCLLLLLAPGLSAAQPRPSYHRIKPGESWKKISQKYLGSGQYAQFLIAANPKVKMRRGNKLIVPWSYQITTKPGDTWASLADEYLDSAARDGFLALHNNGVASESLAAGVPISIPFTVTTTSKTKESWSKLSRRFFGDSKYARQIQRFNEAVGHDKIFEIPFIAPSKRVKILGGDQAVVRQRKHNKLQKQAEAAVKLAQKASRFGNYAKVRRLLAAIDTAYIDHHVALHMNLLLATAYIAYRDKESAASCAASIFTRSRDFKPDPQTMSPLLVSVFRSVGKR